MEHARAGWARPHPAPSRTHPEALRVLVRPDVLTETHGAHLAPIPVPVRRDRDEVTVEVEIIHEQPFDPRIAIPLGEPLAQDARPGLVQHLVRLDVDAPRAAARGHGAVRLEREYAAATGEVPLGVEDPHPRVADARDEVAGLVLGAAYVDDHLVAQVEDGLDRRNDRVVEPDRVPDDGEAGRSE